MCLMTYENLDRSHIGRVCVVCRETVMGDISLPLCFSTLSPDPYEATSLHRDPRLSFILSSGHQNDEGSARDDEKGRGGTRDPAKVSQPTHLGETGYHLF